MPSPVLTTLTKLFKPAVTLIDELHTSDEEKLKAKTAMLEVQLAAAQQLLQYEARLVEAQTSVVRAEAQGQSWIQRAWRPITMLTFLVLVVADAFGLLAFRLSAEAWTLMQIGLGGYVIGRSGEKIAPNVARAMGDRRAARALEHQAGDP